MTLGDSKPTSGAYRVIVGPNSFAFIMSFQKKQTAVAHSGTESEIIAFEEAVRTEGLKNQLPNLPLPLDLTNHLNNHFIILCTLKLPIATPPANLSGGGGTFYRHRVTQ